MAMGASSEFSPNGHSLKANEELPAGKRIMLACRFEDGQAKGVETLIEAVTSMPEHRDTQIVLCDALEYTQALRSATANWLS